ncbi:MAG: hypothetical protein HEQ16_04945 [Bosea sp.]|jgi:phage tail tube protein FII|nr:hypothetical protein [Bosea sp. (in: a-proteobacteria)]
MASLAFLPIRAANIFADGLNVGLPLTGAKVPLPAETGESVTFAGVRGAIELMNTTEAIELAFTTKGLQPDLIRQFAIGYGERRTYTLLGALVDEMALTSANRVIQLEATVIGRMSTADIEKFEGGGMPGTEYAIKSVSRYVLRAGGQVLARYDLMLGGWLDAGGIQGQIAQTIGLNV